MRIGAYQFTVTGNAEENFAHIHVAIKKANQAKVKLLVFPECAVTGYPPYSMRAAADVDGAVVSSVHQRIRALSIKYGINLIVGTITKKDGKSYNTAMMFSPDGKVVCYGKRALWGWDRDNFTAGNESGILEIDSWRIGVRLCYEVRFPEYFRELYREETDLNVILFFDSSSQENPERYRMIQAHIQTRAVENVCFTLAENAANACQTAPTAFFDRSGKMLCHLKPESEAMLVYDMDQAPLDFGESGRKEISDFLLKQVE